MGKIWRAVAIAALILLVLGILLAGAGWLTGASMGRIESVFSDDFRSLAAAGGHLRDGFFALLHSVGL